MLLCSFRQGHIADSDIFFFQAEDGIRDYKVTGVQTCALPIYSQLHWASQPHPLVPASERQRRSKTRTVPWRSEERRVGKESRARGGREHKRKKYGKKGRRVGPVGGERGRLRGVGRGRRRDSER